MSPKTQQEALTQALVLAVNAATEEQSKRALDLAQQFTSGLSEIDVQRCKKDAEQLVKSS